MIIYAESSAVLAWLFGETTAEDVSRSWAGAERMFSSTLTILECHRALARAEALDRINAAAAREARLTLDATTQSWGLVEMTGPALARAAQAFPKEPVRALDAIHLATALETQTVGRVAMLSLDDRIRANASAMGMTVVP